MTNVHQQRYSNSNESFCQVWLKCLLLSLNTSDLMKQANVLLSWASIIEDWFTLNVLLVIAYVSYVSITSFLIPPYAVWFLNKVIPNMYQPLVSEGC